MTGDRAREQMTPEELADVVEQVWTVTDGHLIDFERAGHKVTLNLKFIIAHLRRLAALEAKLAEREAWYLHATGSWKTEVADLERENKRLRAALRDIQNVAEDILDQDPDGRLDYIAGRAREALTTTGTEAS